MAKFKVGDRVVVHGRSHFGADVEGRLGTITRDYVDEDGELSVRISSLNNEFCIKPSQLELELVSEEQPKSKFKVGDRVRVVKNTMPRSVTGEDAIGKEFIITANQQGSSYPYRGKENWTVCRFNDEELQLVAEMRSLYDEPEPVYPYGVDYAKPQAHYKHWAKEGPTKQPKEGNIMTNVVDRIKKIALSADDKLLRKYNLQDSNGQFTEEAEEVLTQMLLEERKSDLVAKAQVLEAEDKKSK